MALSDSGLSLPGLNRENEVVKGFAGKRSSFLDIPSIIKHYASWKFNAVPIFSNVEASLKVQKEVTTEVAHVGLESSNRTFGVDFTKSNGWTVGDGIIFVVF